MRFTSSNLTLLVAALAGVASSACQAGGVGDPCIPEDEYRGDFPGYDFTEVNVESRSFQCETRVCLAAYFNGRVTCPYGQVTSDSQTPPPGTRPTITSGVDTCYVPDKGEDELVRVTVDPQFTHRQRGQAVYCSCRCAGSDKNARYCECPSGYSCEKLVPDYGLAGGQLSGSYCVKEGTSVKNPDVDIDQTTCSSAAKDCGPAHPSN